MQTPIIMQIILTLIGCITLYKAWTRFHARSMGFGLFMMWLVGIVVACIFVWQPERASRISELLGVGRGVDVFVYIGVATLFYIALRIFIRLEKQESLITDLVTKIALLEDEIRRK